MGPAKLNEDNPMKTLTLIVTGTGLALTLAGCSSDRPYTQRDAAVGAATGAVIGGVIGHQSGETGAGAAIGAAAGAAVGAAAGDRADSSENRRVNYTSDRYMALMTPDEIATLRARARNSNRSDVRLTDYLTDEEKANLRRRDREERSREIGE
jgi:uncharacterized protein YcfJ